MHACHLVRSRRFGVSLLKISTRDKVLLLSDPSYDVGQARFSPDGRWIAFTGRMDSGRSQLFLAPFREQAPANSKEWIPLTDGKRWERSPQWSPDGKLIYFASSRDGYRCVWAQRLDGASKPAGEAFALCWA